MKALEFKSKVKDNQILIPSNIQPELKSPKDNIRVIVLFEDSDIYDDSFFQQTTQDHFLDGYSDSDSIYDNY
ncbi:MAG: hypothetical protein K9H26_06330 [Prolixibacteraceae bacterium]|nr:hypothetical protein [Prolixibacteraceae bacterium]